jgi:hypothetical protein
MMPKVPRFMEERTGGPAREKELELLVEHLAILVVRKHWRERTTEVLDRQDGADQDVCDGDRRQKLL